MNKLQNIFFALVGLLLLVSCKTQNLMIQSKENTKYQHLDADSAFLYESAYEYHIRHDDKVSVSFWGHDDLSVGSIYGIYNSNEVYGKWLMVDVRGNITLPRLGNFKIEGMSVAEAEDTLVASFKRWIVNPVIEVKVLNKEITILGELRNPGKYVVERDNNSLLELVSMAGGYEFYANLKSIKIIRQYGDKVKMMNLDLTAGEDYFKRNIQLHPGDLVVVPSKKNKEFDKRVSVIIPLASSATAAGILIGTFL